MSNFIEVLARESGAPNEELFARFDGRSNAPAVLALEAARLLGGGDEPQNQDRAMQYLTLALRELCRQYERRRRIYNLINSKPGNSFLV